MSIQISNKHNNQESIIFVYPSFQYILSYLSGPLCYLASESTLNNNLVSWLWMCFSMQWNIICFPPFPPSKKKSVKYLQSIETCFVGLQCGMQEMCNIADWKAEGGECQLDSITKFWEFLCYFRSQIIWIIICEL